MTPGAPQTERRPPPTAAPLPRGRLETAALTAHRGVAGLRAALRRWEAKAPRVVAVLRSLFYPFALVLVGQIAYRAARETDFSKVHYWPLAAAFCAAFVWYLSLAVGWASLVGDRRAVRTWCRTQVARYLPGAIWAVAARATTVSGRIRDKLTAVTAENVIVLLVSLAVGGVWAGAHDWRWLAIVPLIAAPLLVSGWLERRTRLTRRGIHRTAATYAVGYAAYGVAGILVQTAVSGGLSLSHALYVAGASCVAWAVGLVVVFAPGGVGVREVVYVWMLASLFPRVELEAAAVTMRLVTVFAELAILALVSRPRRSSDDGPRATGGVSGQPHPDNTKGATS